jgi:hypothetical protein
MQREREYPIEFGRGKATVMPRTGYSASAKESTICAVQAGSLPLWALPMWQLTGEGLTNFVTGRWLARKWRWVSMKVRRAEAKTLLTFLDAADCEGEQGSCAALLSGRQGCCW